VNEGGRIVLTLRCRCQFVRRTETDTIDVQKTTTDGLRSKPRRMVRTRSIRDGHRIEFEIVGHRNHGRIRDLRKKFVKGLLTEKSKTGDHLQMHATVM